MEGERSWKEVLNKDIRSSQDVAWLLDRVALRLCGEK